MSRDLAGAARAVVEPVVPPPPSTTDVELLEFERHLLSALAEAINSDLDLRRVLQTVTDVGTEVSRAQFGAFFYNDRDEFGHVYQLHVLSGAGLETFEAMPKPRITALFEPTFSGVATVRIDDVTADERFSGLPAGHLPVRSYLAVPVVTRTGEVIGALLFGHSDTQRFDFRCEQVMQVVAAQAAVAVENARLFAGEQAARQRAEEATARLALLQSLTARLSSALTTSDAVDAVAEMLTTPLGLARAGLFVRDDQGLVHVQRLGSGADHLPAHMPMLTVLRDDIPNPVRTAETTRSAVIIQGAARFASEYPQLAAMLTRVPATVIALPLTMAGQVIGVCTLSSDAPRHLEAADIEMLVAASIQLASAVERARLFEAERSARAELAASIQAATETSRTLQRSLLPRTLPRLDDLRIAVRYQASSNDAEVGGDWYDVVPTASGCVLVIGDVQGHNLAAAALMGQLRTALHAYLAEGHPIEIAVARANDLMLQLTDDMIASCCVAEIDLRQAHVRVVRAGHPSPVCLARDSTLLSMPERVGLPLGAIPGASWEATTLPLSDGDRIVLYTDGLIERRGVDIYAGLATLRHALQQLAGSDAELTAESVVRELGDQTQDDVAILVCDVEFPVADDDAARRTWSAAIAGTTHDVGPLRHQARAQLRLWGLRDLDYAVTLAVSELATNVLRHTGQAGILQLQRLPTGLRMAVTDGHDGLPSLDLRPGLTATGGRGLMMVQQLASRWGVERHAAGKTIWIELDVSEPADEQRAGTRGA